MYYVGHSTNLEGEVYVSGSKNATLPILAACILLQGTVFLRNVPRIGDVYTFLSLLESIGARYTFTENTLEIDTKNLSVSNISYENIKKIRASILLLWPIVFLFGSLSIPSPGGCKIGKRPIDHHLQGLEACGYFCYKENDMIRVYGSPKEGDIVLYGDFSVTATENLILTNVCRNGKTVIYLAAIEPHVMYLIYFLNKAGARIEVGYDHTIIIEWVKRLRTSVDFSIPSDYIEAGTFLIIGALLSKQYIDIHNVRIADLHAFRKKLHETGAITEIIGDESIRVYKTMHLKAVWVQTNIFPGFPTDLQSPFCVLLTQAEGVSKVHEILFEWRLNFLVELEKMRAHIAILNPHQALIFWKTLLKGTMVTSWDLRAGVAMVIAGMVAEWETYVTNIEYIERGYERFVEKLQALGANIEKKEQKEGTKT